MAERPFGIPLNHARTDGSEPSDNSRVLTEAFGSPQMRRVLQQEAIPNYAKSLAALGVAPEDVTRAVRKLAENPLKRRQLEAVYGSQRAANSQRNGKGEGH